MEQTVQNPLIAICTPGFSFSWAWMHCWTQFLPRVMQNYSVFNCFATSHNIYTVRNHCVDNMKSAANLEDYKYILWIDSDNLFYYQWFEELVKILDTRPEVSGVGAWYLVQSGLTGGGEVAAGDINWEDGSCKQTTVAQIKAATDLIEVDFLGFGFFLMRPSVIKDAGINPFNPLFDQKGGIQGDDVSFLRKAQHKGHRFFIHPKLQAPHLKLVPLSFEVSSGSATSV